MDDGLLPPIVENQARCPACGAQYVTSYRQGNVRVSSGQECPRCKAPSDERRHSRRPPKKSASRNRRSVGVA